MHLDFGFEAADVHIVRGGCWRSADVGDSAAEAGVALNFAGSSYWQHGSRRLKVGLKVKFRVYVTGPCPTQIRIW